MIDIFFGVVIKNGYVVDGSGNPWFKADVGIEGEKIAKVDDLSSAGVEMEIDAESLVVAPGFINIHTHLEISFRLIPKMGLADAGDND